jgi:hypothetical protein
MPFASQPSAEPTTPRDRHRIAVAVGLLAAVLAAVAIWAAVRPGPYGSSRDGCVTVTLPSTTGGALVHACGAQARAMCRRAYATAGQVSLLTRPQCRLAGLLPQRPGRPGG